MIHFDNTGLAKSHSANPANLVCGRARAHLFVCLIVTIQALGFRTAQAEQPFPLEPADTSSPRSTLRSFREDGRTIYDLIVAQKGERTSSRALVKPAANRMIRCLDLSQQPDYLRKSVAAESAVCLLEVLDRVELPPEDEIPGPDDLLNADGELLAKWRVPHTDITLYRVPDGARQGEYLFSPETVDLATEYYDRVAHLPYRNDQALRGLYRWFLSEPGTAWLAWIVHRLPDWTRARFYGEALWQWFGLLLVVAAGLGLMVATYTLGRRRSQRMLKVGIFRHVLTLWFPLVALGIPLLVQHIASRYLVITGMTLVVVNLVTSIVFLFGIVVLIVSVGNRVAEIMLSSPQIHPRGIDAQFIRIICRVVSLILSVIVFLEGGQYLGIPVTTLLAGAGVGGLTIALAAQDTLRNLFGSMMIMLDKPFRVGERIIAKGYDGVVQEIGLRSTRLRLLTGHEVTIPNDDMARADIENIGRRPHVRRVSDIALPLDLTPEQAEQAVNLVREILENHEGMLAEYPPRVFLNEFNRDSINLRMMYWYHPPDYWDFMAFSQQVNLRIKREFAAAGISFALPTSNTVMSQQTDQPWQFAVVDEGPQPAPPGEPPPPQS